MAHEFKSGSVWIMKTDTKKIIQLHETYSSGFAFSYRDIYGRVVKANSPITAERLRTAFDPFLAA